MKTIILAGGWGSRLGNLTETVPKPMVNIGSKPVLWHIMKIYSYYGYNEFVIALGVKAEIIKSYFYNFEHCNNDFTVNLSNGEIIYHEITEKCDWKVTLVDTGLNTLKGGRIKRLEKYLTTDLIMMTYGDCVSDIDLNKLVSFHKSHGKMITITGVHPPSRFGEINEIDGQVTLFEEKAQTSSGLINGGFMVFNRHMLDYLTPNEHCDFEYGVLEKLVSLGEVMVYKYEGMWECMDHERDVVHLNKIWNEGTPFWKKW
jgi:glucose-1-phosphate cytidylyltransferase